MTLYSCKHDGDQYRITKWDSDFNIQSSYLCTITECECPAGSRDRCRHREMLPQFLEREGAIAKGWFLDFDQGGWYEPIEEQPALPEGVTMLTLDDPTVVHNAIAEAVGEPEAIINPQPAPKQISIRRW